MYSNIEQEMQPPRYIDMNLCISLEHKHPAIWEKAPHVKWGNADHAIPLSVPSLTV